MNRPTEIVSALIVALPCLAAQTSQPATDRNIYLLDRFYVEAFDQWRPVGRARFDLLRWNSFEPNPVLEVKVDISKTGQMIHGIERRGLGLPLPQALRFRVWQSDHDLWVVLGDKAGRRVASVYPIGDRKTRVWCPIEIPLAEMKPIGGGANPIRDLDLIAFLTQESSGEYDEEEAALCFSRIEAVYPKGSGPLNPTFTREDLGALVKPLAPMLERIDALLAEARGKGIDVRYPAVSHTVLHRYAGEVSSMMHPKDPFVAKRTGEFLLECAHRTQGELEEMLRQPDRAIRMPAVPLRNLQRRDGSFVSGDRPAILTGVCGWFSPGSFEQLAPMGYTSVSIEIGPTGTLDGTGNPKPDGVASIRGVMDAASRNNMVCDLLVSPHYLPEWARSKWPGTDATLWRQKTNEFMPWTITDPHLREVIARHLGVLIPQVREHPSLLCYNLLNEAWYRPIGDFPASQWAAFRKQNPRLDEWQSLARLTTENVNAFLRWFMDELQKHDRSHAVQIKAFDTTEVACIDREAIGEILTASGMDSMPSWPDWTGRLAADFSWSLLRHDYHRSLQPDKPIVDGEFHISGGTYATPASYFRAAMWVIALHGRDMANCWVFDRVDDSSLYWHANGVEAVGRASLDLLRLSPEIHAFQRQRSPLAVYYGGTAMSNAYLACLFQDLDVGVVTDRRILAGGLSDCTVLVVPAGSRMPAEVRLKVDAFRKARGFVVACPAATPVEALWQQVHRAVEQAKLPRLVRTNRWGIECRAAGLGDRKLLYAMNHGRKPVEVALKSDWPLAGAVDLRTQAKLDATTIRLQPLEIRLIELK
jgi:hypothetical protein